ncbi:MAG: DUF3501 family protein [Acidimicrobiales bacterium]
MTSPQRPGGPAVRRELTLADILDLRAYERVREEYRRQVMAIKRRRRVSLGPIMTVVFESVETVRFQVQEMARVERIATDEGVLGELEVYNRLLPAPGELSATLFIELTTEADLRRWLPRLVGIERALSIELPAAGANGQAGGADGVTSEPEASHAEALTRESVTPAVHYLRFSVTAAQVAALTAGPAALAARHPEYQAEVVLDDDTRGALVADLEGRTELLALG